MGIRNYGRHAAAALVSAALPLSVLACSASAPPPAIVAHGTMETTTNILDGDTPSEAYPDIRAGTQVIVVGSSGTVIATGTLAYVSSGEASAVTPWADYFAFTVTVPGGLPRYGIEVGNGHGTVWESAAEMRHGPILCLGDGC